MEWIPTSRVERLYHASGGVWQSERCNVQDLLNRRNAASGSYILFFDAEKRKTLTPVEGDLRASLSSRFAIPNWLWSVDEQDYNGYFYGASIPSAVNGPSSKHVSIFRFMIKYVVEAKPRPIGLLPNLSYDWHVLTFVIYWDKDGESALLCFNVPSCLRDGLQQSILGIAKDDIASHPFSFHQLVLKEVTKLYDQAIWQFRDFVRETERHRPTIDHPNSDYVGMHELARHTMHCSEVLTTGLNVMLHMLAELDRFSSNHSFKPDTPDPGPAIRYQQSLLQFMLNRSLALESRLRNEINLTFHITAQHANILSAEIARAAKVDSSATKTISILGLFFLPGTFVSAVFSMSFFNYSPSDENSGTGEWHVSDKFWVYWVVAIPVTIFTVLTWWWWTTVTGPFRSREQLVVKSSRLGSSKHPTV